MRLFQILPKHKNSAYFSLFHTPIIRIQNARSIYSFAMWPKGAFTNFMVTKLDKSFTEEGFLFGAKAQIGFISSQLAAGDMTSLEGIIEPPEHDRLCRRLKLVNDGTKEWLKIDVQDIQAARMHYIIHLRMYFSTRALYAVVPVSVQGYHSRYDTATFEDGKPPSKLDKQFFCTYYFKKKIQPDFDVDAVWQISSLRHKKNIFMTAI